MILGEDNEKMSKSRGNVIPADHVLKAYGADAVRLYEMFLGPLEQVKPWNTHGIEGISRFLGRVWRLVHSDQESSVAVNAEALDDDMKRRMHKTIRKVSEDTSQLKFNTAIAEMMVYVNELHKSGCRNRTAIETLLLLLAPYAPHICEELWQAIGNSESVGTHPYPEFDETLVADNEVTIAVQVNGKLRGTFTAPAGTSREELIDTARNVESVAKFLAGTTIKKEIAVPDKLVSFAVKTN